MKKYITTGEHSIEAYKKRHPELFDDSYDSSIDAKKLKYLVSSDPKTDGMLSYAWLQHGRLVAGGRYDTSKSKYFKNQNIGTFSISVDITKSEVRSTEEWAKYLISAIYEENTNTCQRIDKEYAYICKRINQIMSIVASKFKQEGYFNYNIISDISKGNENHPPAVYLILNIQVEGSQKLTPHKFKFAYSSLQDATNEDWAHHILNRV